jgi:hypothetical protein
MADSLVAQKFFDFTFGNGIRSVLTEGRGSGVAAVKHSGNCLCLSLSLLLLQIYLACTNKQTQNNARYFHLSTLIKHITFIQERKISSENMFALQQ